MRFCRAVRQPASLVGVHLLPHSVGASLPGLGRLLSIVGSNHDDWAPIEHAEFSEELRPSRPSRPGLAATVIASRVVVAAAERSGSIAVSATEHAVCRCSTTVRGSVSLFYVRVRPGSRKLRRKRIRGSGRSQVRQNGTVVRGRTLAPGIVVIAATATTAAAAAAAARTAHSTTKVARPVASTS